VANGTPAELKLKSENAGAVTVRVGGVGAEDLRQRLSSLALARQVTMLGSDNGAASARVIPRHASRDLGASIASLCQTEKWRLEELHTEEGRLDEVFRSITSFDTAQEKKQ
jgi:ABC-2 type transport system ATP-binding protein